MLAVKMLALTSPLVTKKHLAPTPQTMTAQTMRYLSIETQVNYPVNKKKTF